MSSLNPEALLSELSDALAAVKDGDALEVTKARYLGKSGIVTEALKGLVSLPVEERKEAGGKINKIKAQMEAAINDRRACRCRGGRDPRQEPQGCAPAPGHADFSGCTDSRQSRA